MTRLKMGELFAGYGGLGSLGIGAVLPVEPAWFVEFDKAPSRILAHHWPDVPNYGDITTVDFTAVEPVDVITGGFPCQDVSHAGRRAGLIRDGEGRTRSGLWGHMLRAIDELRPSLVVAENVKGLLSARADSDVEPCPWCLGDDPSEPPMRALGAVLADLADVGYDAAWYGLRAADVGAAHGRFRVFIFAWPADAEGDTRRLLHGDGVRADGPRGAATGDVTLLLPTPRAEERMQHNSRDNYDRLLPTPTSRDHKGRNQRDDETCLTGALLPTPRTKNNENLQSEGYGGKDGNYYGLLTGQSSWGDYAPAIARWERVIGRPAPAPTEPGKNGNPRLSPLFVEWLMGLPAGHVTDPAIGLTRNEQLKALGNGVVPQQAAAAAQAFLADFAALEVTA